MKIGVGKRVPGGALDRSTRVESRTTASMPKSINASFASHTAPGRRRHRAMPAATPTLVIARRAPRNSSENVDLEPRFHTLDEACSARLAGFQTVSSSTRTTSQPPTTVIDGILAILTPFE